jgi:hypothetical protein
MRDQYARGAGLLPRSQPVEEAVAEHRARHALERGDEVRVVLAGHAEAVDQEAEEDRAEHAAEERADDPRPAAVGQEHGEVPEGEPHHRPGEQSHQWSVLFVRVRLGARWRRLARTQ